jgi:hypothetical protein
MLSLKPLILCVVILASGVSIGRASASETGSPASAVKQSGVKKDLTAQPGGKIQLAGQWESTAFGRQTLTARPDGTATIAMTLSAFAVPIYGRKVNLDLEWELNGKYLTQRIVGGSPERSVEKLIRKFGDTHEYLVVEHSASHLLVKQTTGGSDLVRWTAVKSNP